MSEIIITGPGSYRTIDGRRVEIVGRPATSERLWKASNLSVMAGGNARVEHVGQVYYGNGNVFDIRSGEENDRIVGPWATAMISGPGEYVTRDGRKATVNIIEGNSVVYHTSAGGSYSVFAETGLRNSTRVDANDIVGPWVELAPSSPVQEVTERRIVSGTYGIVGVNGGNVWIPTQAATAAQLRDAARVLTELADFMDA